MTRGRKWQIGCGLPVLVFAILAVVLPEQRNAVLTFFKVYREQAAATTKHDYSGTSIDNLRHLQTALLLYNDSEGQFPDSKAWMDAIENRIVTDDLNKGEAEKKLIRPDLLGQSGQFGYAMNDVCSGKYKGDVKEPNRTPLLFESTEAGRNAHGDPDKIRHGIAITVDGTLLRP